MSSPNPVFNKALHQLLGDVFPHVNAVIGEGKWEEYYRVHARMRCDQPAVNAVVVVASNDENENDNDTTTEEGDTDANNITLIPDYQTSPVIMSAAVLGKEGMGAPWGAIQFRITNRITKDCKTTVTFEAATEKRDEEE